MQHQGFLAMALLALLAACFLAANEVSRPDDWSVVQLYAYWILRIGIQSLLFAAVLQLLILIPPASKSRLVRLGAASLISYVPFVLAITALDIVLGLPELGLPVPLNEAPTSNFSAFALELAYLLDNHLFLCAMLSVPLFLTETNFEETLLVSPQTRASKRGDAQPNGQEQPGGKFFATLSPPLRGKLVRAEAQEHYVKLVSSEETRMVLYRFSDILREVPAHLGMQVHRSHWISKDAVKRLYKSGNNTRIVTIDGEDVPVSRRFAREAAEKLKQQPTTG